MIIHIWMHWFWITTAYFKGFLFFTASTISISCISHPFFAEAGLPDNETLTPVTTILPIRNESSQITQNPTIVHPPDTTPPLVVSSNMPEETYTEELDTSKTAFGSTSDLADTYNGGTLDVYSYPFKKVTKFAHPKYAKMKAKGKLNDEPGNQEHKVDAVKIVEEKVNINISVEDGVSRSEPEIDKSNDSLSEESTPEIAIDDPESVTTIVENVTETLMLNVTTKVVPSLTEKQKEIEVLKNETLVIENKVEESRAFTTVEPFAVRNRVAAATSAQNFKTEESGLNAGSITGITLGILVVFSLFGAVSFILYRRRYLNKPQVLHDKCSNLDSSGYIDETSLRENSEEMYSLDNDSFLNSLEAMTIQNYWTESVKHTKL